MEFSTWVCIGCWLGFPVSFESTLTESPLLTWKLVTNDLVDEIGNPNQASSLKFIMHTCMHACFLYM